LADMRYVRRQYEHFDNLFSAHAKLQLVYEDLTSEQRIDSKVSDSICDFLGLQRAAMKSRLVKMNPDPLYKIVINYDELATALSGTEFADLLR
jgi:hypothetical protein